MPRGRDLKNDPFTDEELSSVSGNVYESSVKGRRDFRSAYRKAKKTMDKYGLALMMIREGVANPPRIADEALQGDEDH